MKSLKFNLRLRGNNLFEKSLRHFLPQNSSFVFKFASLPSIEYFIYFLPSAHDYIVLILILEMNILLKRGGGTSRLTTHCAPYYDCYYGK